LRLNTLLGNVSFQTAIQFYGLTGQFNNTVVAEKLTSQGIQDLLYKASTTLGPNPSSDDW
jgi:hypothetical protein